jgi:hypothetical protein
MKRTIFLLGVLVLVLAFLGGSRTTLKTNAQVEARDSDPGLPNYDLRTDKSNEAADVLLGFRQTSNKDAVAVAAVRDRFVAGEDSLRERVPSLKVEYNDDLRIPEVISPDVRRGDNFLTGRSAAARPEILRRFMKENSGLLGLGDAQIDQLEITADYKDPEDDLSFVHLEQRINRVPVFRGEVKAVLTGPGEIGRVINNLAPGLDYESLSTDFRNPEEAVQAAFRYAGRKMTAEDFQVNAAESTDLKTKFGNGDWATTAEKIYFPTEPGVAVPTWRVIIWEPVNVYMVIVDAATGRLLWRKNATEGQTQSATYNVYANPLAMINAADSPAPLSPGPVNPGFGTQGSIISRTNVTRIGNEFPYTFNNNGWITDGNNTTDGNAVEAGLDRDSTDGVDATPAGFPFRQFTSTWNPPPGNPAPGDNPLTPQAQRGAVIQMFYTMNVYHDELYRLGFTEGAGNFQQNNFNHGGLGNDRFSAQVQDISGMNNANFANINGLTSVVPDGTRGRIQMYLWDGPTPDRDGAADAEIVIHEATHGTSNRIIANASGLTTNMARGLGEGWSDFYAHALLSQPGDPVQGIYAMGGYATQSVVSGFTANHYYGIRRFPKAVIGFKGSNGRSHNPLSFRHLNANCNTEIGTPQAIGTISAFARGPIGSTTCDQFHNAGEIWSSALWEVRARFIARLGWEQGNRRILTLVTLGMKSSPANPTFLQARDAIIAVTKIHGKLEDIADIWEGFRLRGMGVNASIQNDGAALGGNDTVVTENFDAPVLTVTISPTSLSFTSTAGGDSPAPKKLDFNLNSDWTVTDNADWLTVTPEPFNHFRASVGVSNAGLAAGTYAANIRFDVPGAANSPVNVPVTLTVKPSPIVPNPTSLSFSTLTGGTNPVSQPLTVTNAGDSPLVLGFSDDAAWLDISSTPVTVAPGTTVTRPVIVNNTGLALGTYNATIMVKEVGEVLHRTVPVTLTVKPNPPVISVNPSTLSVSAEVDGRNPAPVRLTISNTGGGGTLKWTASDDVGWLSVSPAAWNVPTETPNTLTVTFNTAGLGIGTHNGNISLSAPGAAPVNVLVEIIITPPTQ